MKAYLYNPYRKGFNEWIKSKAKEINSNAKVLEIGGNKVSYKHYFKTTDFLCTDIEHGKGIDSIVDVQKIKYGSEKFDVVLCFNVLEHVLEPIDALREMHRVLKKGGILLMSVPFTGIIHDEPHDYYRYTHYFFEKKLVGYKSVSITPVYFFPPIFPIFKKFINHYRVVCVK